MACALGGLTVGPHTLGLSRICPVRETKMSVFNEEDTTTLKVLGYTAGGFAALTVFLIILALNVT